MFVFLHRKLNTGDTCTAPVSTHCQLYHYSTDMANVTLGENDHSLGKGSGGMAELFWPLAIALYLAKVSGDTHFNPFNVSFE